MNRRNLLAAILAGGGAVVGGILAIPALLVAWSPAWKGRRGEAWRPVGRLEGFRIGQVELAVVPIDRGDWSRALDEKSVYVWRRADGEIVVFARNCTDLSCPVTFDAGSECFFCPCHGGIFAKDGTPLAGPPSRPLYRYQHRVADGLLEIDLYSLPPMT